MKIKTHFIFPVIWILIALGNTFEKYFTGMLVNWTANDLGKLKSGILILLAVLLAKYLLHVFGRWYLNFVLEKNIADTRKNILEKLLETDFAEIEAIAKGDVLSKVTLGLKRLQKFEEDVKPDLFQTGVEGALALILCIFPSVFGLGGLWEHPPHYRDKYHSVPACESFDRKEEPAGK